jgi:pimeloyl-ACP methyl ester carboxylesterase
MELAHDVVGEGPPMVLVHGITESRESWRPLMPALAGSWRVLAVDLRGHGSSPRGDAYDPLTLAADVHETARGVFAADATSPLVVGHSLGGVVATAYAAAFPTRGAVNVDQPLRLAAFQEGLRQLEPLLRGDAASFRRAVSAVFDSMAGPLPEHERMRIEALRAPDQDVVLSIWTPVLESSIAELDAQVDALASAVSVPYLSLHGIDPGDEAGEWLRARIPTAVVEVWADHGHYPHLVAPDLFLTRLRAFDPALT